MMEGLSSSPTMAPATAPVPRPSLSTQISLSLYLSPPQFLEALQKEEMVPIPAKDIHI
jgi:hypothetical protein